MKMNKNIEEFTISKWSVVYTDSDLITRECFFKTRERARRYKHILKKYYISKISIFKNEVSLNLPISGIKSIRKTLTH